MVDYERRDFLRLMSMAGVAAASPAWARPPGGALARDMTHRQRIEAALKGELTDRAPFGFWWHFANRDWSPRRLAELAVALQRRLDLDFIKFSPYGLYSVVDWGVTLEIFAGDMDPPVQASYPIQSPDDWTKLEPRSGEDGEYLVLLEAQRIALDMLDGQVPFTQTIFSPLTSAAKMVGRDQLPIHIREHPDELHEGLRIITETTRRFVAQVVERGADGLFFASQAVDPNYLTPDGTPGVRQAVRPSGARGDRRQDMVRHLPPPRPGDLPSIRCWTIRSTRSTTTIGTTARLSSDMRKRTPTSVFSAASLRKAPSRRARRTRWHGKSKTRGASSTDEA